MMRGSWMVVLIAAACGGGSSGAGHLPDAPPAPDAAIDGNADSPVTLTVTSGGAPRPGLHVYFLAADGTPVKTADTGADGTASAVMAAGGSVTVLDPFAVPDALAVGDNVLFTFMAVKPGDHLRLSNSQRRSVSLALTAPSVPGATDYDVFTTCGTGSISPGAGGGPTVSGTIELDHCPGTADIAIVASQFDAESQVSTPISGLFHAGVAIDGSAVTLVDAYSALTDVSLTYTHVPAGVSLDVSHAPLVAGGPLGPFAASVSGADGTLTGTIHEPAVAAASSAVRTLLDVASGEHQIIDWGASSASYTLDLSTALVRAVTAPPSFDFASGALVWSEATEGAVPDAITTLIGVTRSAQSRHWDWLVIAPYSPARLVLPRLPADVADWTPVAGDTTFIDSVSLVKLTGGYDALRTQDLDVGNNTSLSGVTGATGHIAQFISSGSSRLQGGSVDSSAIHRRVSRRAAR